MKRYEGKKVVIIGGTGGGHRSSAPRAGLRRPKVGLV